MVLNTQLQLKWPNHSSHLLTGLTSLFKNEQLVDCTLNCNKHSLKVHRSVLAACSPYFERELENNPSIIVKDVQFNVLQALIEFMYYGETRISEDNLTSLIEAAKLFEVKGLSEMDLLASNENSIVLSVVAMNGNGVKSSSDRMETLVFDTNTQPVQLETNYKNAQQSALPNTISPEDSEDSNSNLVDPTQPHSCRDFVVTPTESAQILLSLARSYSEKQQLPQQITTIQADTSCDVLPTTVFNDQNDQNFVVDTSLTNGATPNATTNPINEQLSDSKNSSVVGEANDSATELYIKYNSNGDTPDMQNNKSLLATLLTREPATQSQSPSKNLQYYENYKNLYECESSSQPSEITMDQNEADTNKATNSFTLPPDSILEYPFLVQTPDGLVDTMDMLNVFDNSEVFDPNTGCKATIKFVCKENVLTTLAREANPIMMSSCADTDTKIKSMVDNHELEHIKQNTEDELRDDPEAVVLCKVNENGQVEKYVLSSADISALKAMNEQLKLEQQQQQQQQQQIGFNSAESPHIEVELPTAGNKSLITRIFSAGDRVEHAISKLPFRRTNSTATGGGKSLVDGGGDEDDVEHVNTISSSSSSSAGQGLIDDTPITVDAHHHENMFEELDNQFSMDCSIENIQSEYGAYEEASKHETQIEHNYYNNAMIKPGYYANAMKDEDEECAVVISGDNIDLHSVMLIQEPTDGDLNLVALSNNNNKGKSNANTSSPASSSSIAFQIFSAADDAYLNGNERPPRRNGVVIDKPTFNGKCDLILNSDDLMNSVLTTVMNHHVSPTVSSAPPGLTTATNTKTTRATNCAADATSFGVRGCRNAKTKRRNSVNDVVADGALTLPFKKVKNAAKNSMTGAIAVTEKKPRRTYRRRSTSLNEDSKLNENYATNGEVYLQNHNNNNNNDNTLIEEIIVDEVL